MAPPNPGTSGQSTTADTRASPLVHVAFKNDATHFIAAVASGFRVFSCSPLALLYERHLSSSHDPTISVAAAELLSDSTVAVVFATADSKGDKRADTMRFWCELYGELMTVAPKKAADVVRGVRLLGDYVAIADDKNTKAYEISSSRLRPVQVMETGANPLGLCSMAKEAGRPLVLACPRPRKGEVMVVWATPRKARCIEVPAHCSGLACLTLSMDGRLLATASSKGTLVRVFSTTDGKKLREFRRGIDRADIHSIAFSADSKWLAVSSDKATIHVFSLNIDLTLPTPNEDSNPDDLPPTPALSPAPDAKQGSSMSFMKVVLPRYFSSEWSLAQFQLREGTKYSVAFGQEQNTVIAIGMDGSFYRCEFHPVKGGEMTQLEYRNFMSLNSEARKRKKIIKNLDILR